MKLKISLLIITSISMLAFIPHDTHMSTDQQLNLFEIWNERYDTDFKSNLELEEYRIKTPQLFSFNIKNSSVEIISSFHDSDHDFGYYTKEKNNNKKELLFEITKYGIFKNGEYKEIINTEKSIGFYITQIESNTTWTSEDENQLVVYDVPDVNKLLMAWESNSFKNSNKDFNDVVVEIDHDSGLFMIFGKNGSEGIATILGLTSGLSGISSSSSDNYNDLWKLPLLWAASGEEPNAPSRHVIPETQTGFILILGLISLYIYRLFFSRQKEKSDG